MNQLKSASVAFEAPWLNVNTIKTGAHIWGRFYFFLLEAKNVLCSPLCPLLAQHSTWNVVGAQEMFTEGRKKTINDAEKRMVFGVKKT